VNTNLTEQIEINQADANAMAMGSDLCGRGEARTKELLGQVIPSQAASGQSSTGDAEGVETRGLSPDNKDPHECPAPSSLRVGEEIVRTSGESRSAAQTAATRARREHTSGNLALTNLQVAGQLASDQT